MLFISDIAVVKITLRNSSSNRNDLKKCRSEVEKVCENSLIKSLIKNICDLREWEKSTIQDYFKFCVWEKQVLTKIDIKNGIVELQGSAADVSSLCDNKCLNFNMVINYSLS